MAKFIFDGKQFNPEKENDEIIYTPFEVIKQSVDTNYINADGYIESQKADGYLGPWTYELELLSKTYYHVQDTGIAEVIIYKQPFNNEDGSEYISYLILMNGYIYNCLPEEMDIIYTTYKEAKLQKMQDEKNKNKI